jgi:hypothetical protein
MDPARARADRDVAHPELVPVVQRRRAAQRQQQHGGDARLCGADAARDARPVVVAERVVGPGRVGQERLVGLDVRADRLRLPRRRDEVEVRRQVEPGAVAADEPLQRQVQRADQRAVGSDGVAPSQADHR